jgi:hypothetical protein
MHKQDTMGFPGTDRMHADKSLGRPDREAGTTGLPPLRTR